MIDTLQIWCIRIATLHVGLYQALLQAELINMKLFLSTQAAKCQNKAKRKTFFLSNLLGEILLLLKFLVGLIATHPTKNIDSLV